MRFLSVTISALAAAVVALASSGAFCADAVASRQMRITLAEGAAIALRSNPDIVIERLTPGIRESLVDRELGAFDPEVFASAKREDSTTPLAARGSVAAGGRTALESRAYSFSTGVEGKFSTGTRYTLEAREQTTADTFNNFAEQYSTWAGVKLSQPLLKNFGADANKMLVRVAEKEKDVSELVLRDRVSAIIAQFAYSYWDLLLLREEFSVRLNALSLAETLLELSRKKLSAGALSMLDVVQAESAVASRKDAVLVAKRTARDKEKDLKLLMAPDAALARDVEIIPTEKAEALPMSIDPERALKQAFANRPDYLAAKAELDKQNLRIVYMHNQTYPVVDLEATYGYNGLGASMNSSFDAMTSNPQWSVGVMLRYPLGNTAASAGLSAARIEAGQALLKLKKIERSVVLEVDSDSKRIVDLKDRLETSGTSSMLAEKTLKAEEEKYRSGRSTTYDVLRTQDDLTRARLSEISAIVDYNKAVIKYNREIGVLVESMGLGAGGAK